VGYASHTELPTGSDSPLLVGAKPALAHLVSKGVLVDLFNEPMTERIGNPESAPNDPFGHRLEQPRASRSSTRIPFIPLHLADPP
jgi:hypothetical protein